MAILAKNMTADDGLPSDGTKRHKLLLVFAFFCLLFSGFLLAYHMGGPTPVLTPDTINDEKFIRTCLDDACYFTGMGTSSELLTHGANFIHFKTFLRFIGVSEDTLHIFLEFVFALSVALTGVAGYRIAKSVGAGTSALMFAFLICTLAKDLSFHPAMTYNHRVIPFFGALFLLLAIKATKKKSLLLLVLSGVVLGIGTNIHMQFLAGFPAIFVFGLFVRGFGAGLLGVLVATLTSFITSFEAFLRNCAKILGIFSFSLFVSAQSGENATGFHLNHLLLISSLVILLAYLLVIFVSNRNGGAKPAFFVPAIFVLFKVLFVVLASYLGMIEVDNKYFLEVLPALGVMGGVIVFEILHVLSGRLAYFISSSPIPVLLASFFIPLLPHPHYSELVGSDGLPHFTLKDMTSLQEYFRSLGWNLQKIITSVRGPSAPDIIDFFATIDHNSKSDEPRPKNRAVLYIFKLKNEDIHETESLIVLSRDEYSSLVAIKEDSLLSIYDFDLCLQKPKEDHCSYKKVTFQEISHAFPSPSKRLRGLLKVRFDVDFMADKRGKVIFMPKMKDRCNGKVLSIRGGSSRILEDGRMAILEPDGQEESGSIEFGWELGSEECSPWGYKGAMPFFLELSGQEANKVIKTFKRLEEITVDRLEGGSNG